jgi:hypothetical protein
VLICTDCKQEGKCADSYDQNGHSEDGHSPYPFSAGLTLFGTAKFGGFRAFVLHSKIVE